MVYDIDDDNYLAIANEELKRVDHLIFVSLKYTRSVDVLKNVLKRLITFYECIINGVLKEAQEKGKTMDTPVAPVKKCAALKEIYPTTFDALIKVFLFLRKIDRAEYAKINEFRRHVALIAHTEDEGDVEVSIDVVTVYYREAQKILDNIAKKLKSSGDF